MSASRAQKTSGMAVASLVLGILSMMGAAILIVPTILAIVFGHISLSRTRRDKTLGGSGIAIAGLVLGYVSIVFGVIFAGLLAAMAIPAFQKVREASLNKVMDNDARLIAAAAQQVMMEKNVTSVSFQVDPETGRVSGPLAEYAKEIMRGTQVVDGVFESPEDTFSLRNPRVKKGEVIIFTGEGRRR
jgi:hypothetical protein